MEDNEKIISIYLNQHNIYQVEEFQYEYPQKQSKISDDSVLEHLKVLSEFHNSILGDKGYVGNIIDNKIGKTMEKYKIGTKKIKRDIKKFEVNSPSNAFEELLVNYGDTFVKRGEKCINRIMSIGYMSIIGRSMERNEICIGNSGFNNLRKTNRIEVIDISDCCFNIVEEDAFDFLVKLKRKGEKLFWRGLVQEYCKYEGLSCQSMDFILALMSYPWEFVKCCNRYRTSKKGWSEDRYTQALIRAMERDGESLI